MVASRVDETSYQIIYRCDQVTCLPCWRTYTSYSCMHCSLLIFSLAIRVHLSSWPCTSSHASTRSGIWSTNWLPGSTRLLGASTQRSLVIARPGITTSAAILAASHASASLRRRHRLDVASSRGVFVMVSSASASTSTLVRRPGSDVQRQPHRAVPR